MRGDMPGVVRIKFNVRVVLVEPEFPINIGSVARVMANFGFDNLYLVKPKALDDTAYMFAKHARRILDNANIVDKLEYAVKGCQYIIGTTGVPVRYEKNYRVSRPISEILSIIRESESNEIAIVFGRESKGLNDKEYGLCDSFMYIPTSEEYPVMNLSHAVAVVLYEVSKMRSEDKVKGIGNVKTRYKIASYDDKQVLFKMYDNLVELVSDRLTFPSKMKQAFHNIIGRTIISKRESKVLTGLFSEINKILKANRPNK